MKIIIDVGSTERLDIQENNLKSTLASFENEVLQTPNFNQDLPIKSNKTFLLEWWNIFFELYSEKLMINFSEKNCYNFSQEILKGVSFVDIFKAEYCNNGLNPNFINQMEISNLLASNPILLNTIESFKNISRSLNINFPFNNSNTPNFDINLFQKNNYQNINTLNNFNNIRNIPFQKDYPNANNKMNSDSSSISISSDKNDNNKIGEEKFHQKLFKSRNCAFIDKDNLDNDFSLKKRKRYIKNNKFVYVHPGSAAAKKMELEKEAQNKLKEEDLVQTEENDDDFNADANSNNNSNEQGDSSNKGKKPRGSRYRGVSRNGNQWQVLIMVNKKKRYVGSYSNEEEAARAYDKVALQNHGTKAKTNFDYVDEEVKKILQEPPLLKLNL